MVRHNVSLNDRKNLIYFNYAFAGAYVYDNVFFIGKHCSPTIIREREGLRHTYYYHSNRIVNGSKSTTYALSHDGTTTRYLSENVFRGHHPAGEPSNDPAGALEAVLELWAAEEASCQQDAACWSDMGAGQRPAAPFSANVRCDLDDARPAEESPGITALLSNAPPNAGPVVEPVMTVNGHPVSAAEFALLLQRHKGAVIRYFRDTYGIRYGSGFWTDSCAFCGESPLQLLKQRAAKEAIRRKLQQAALQQGGHNTLIDPLERRREENECRSQLAAADRVVYGPLFFDEWSHYEYAFSLDCIEIRLQQEKHTEEAYQAWLEEAVEQADVQLLPGAWEGIQVQ
ncbi:hypothetical protein [Paenibacillus sp. RC67]|uniref:hypothetical protein n=1 Tax=Paenibacillus sp. RC67 TaxID=3039392 RepID=UPI0024AE80BC|nr:hypothetical protein [Paenibacillus sp. RC67]